jgi:hypothetical protein
MKNRIIIVLFSILVVFVSITNAQDPENTSVRDSVEKIIIRKSGFMKDEEVVIRYRSSDHQIIEVIDKGEKIPDKDFREYESILWSYLELRNIESLKPRIERLRREVRESSRLDSLKVRRLRLIDEKLDSLRVRLVRGRSRQSRQLLRRTLELDSKLSRVRERLYSVEEIHRNMEKFLDALLEEKIIPDKEDLEIEFRKGDCFIDGRKVPSDTKERIKEIYKEIHQKEINEDKFTLKR